MVFTNQDGVSVETSLVDDQRIAYLADRGYTKAIAVRGKVGYSELAMHTRMSERIGVVAFLRPESMYYAYVLTSDNRWIDGAFHLFSDNTFSVA